MANNMKHTLSTFQSHITKHSTLLTQMPVTGHNNWPYSHNLFPYIQCHHFCLPNDHFKRCCHIRILHSFLVIPIIHCIPSYLMVILNSLQQVAVESLSSYQQTIWCKSDMICGVFITCSNWYTKCEKCKQDFISNILICEHRNITKLLTFVWCNAHLTPFYRHLWCHTARNLLFWF
jgi:hypothetical protein